MSAVAVASLSRDLHGRAIVHELQTRKVSAYLIGVDTICPYSNITWRNDNQATGRILDVDGRWCDVESLDVVWWRRVNQPQTLLPDDFDPTLRDLINNDAKAAFAGLFVDRFRGTWVNDPAKDVIAGNKLYQLTAAKEIGFRVPDTLVSSVPQDVRAFCSEYGGKVVCKKLVGTPLKSLATIIVGDAELSDDSSIVICPSIYQEIIDAEYHLRINCFGDHVSACSIKTPLLDWRRDLTVPFKEHNLEEETASKIAKLTRKFGLRMAIYDAIIERGTGELVWLEVNPQGQFLFEEALSGLGLTASFCDYLIDLADKKL